MLRAVCISLLSVVPLVNAHGHLTLVTSGSQKACAYNTNYECAGAGTLRLRKLIPRSGNTGVCANPPGCEANFICDHCGLEKSNIMAQTHNNKWWTKNPASHWDNPAVWPQKVCMSDDAFGVRGKMNVAPGDSISTKMYVNADHSGLYQFQISCGELPTNQKFMQTPITPWKMLHKSKEFNDGKRVDDRVAGSNRRETDAHFNSTVCTGAACNYRMNRGIQPADSTHCKNDPGDCFVTDTFTIPPTWTCRGSATLRWFWLSSEGPEIYANCLDLNVAGGSSTATPPPTKGPVGTCPASGDCHLDPGCCPSGQKCFEKDKYWASCAATCTPGINPNDEPQYQTPWSCTVLSSAEKPITPIVTCSARWGQCGGQGYAGTTCCQTGAKCVKVNQWYSQCVPTASTYEAAALVSGQCTADEYFPKNMGLETACDCEFGLPLGCVDLLCARSISHVGCRAAADIAANCTLGVTVKTALATCPDAKYTSGGLTGASAGGALSVVVMTLMAGLLA